MSDEEQNLFLRKLRNKIGYGVGWKFKSALWDLISPYVGFVLMIVILIFYALWMR